MASTDLVTLPYAPTPEVSTGDPATVNDAYDTTKQLNGAKIPLGTAVYFRRTDGTIWKCRYVRINSTVAPAAAVAPAYWKDKAHTTVTLVGTEAVTGHGVSCLAGILLNSGITNGNYGFILVAGVILAMAVVAATAAGDALLGTDTQATARVAANTAPTNMVLGWAQTAVAAGVSDVQIVVESL